jgi:hypothetical protein
VAVIVDQLLVSQYHVVFLFEKDKSMWTQFPWPVVAALLTGGATLFGGWVALKSLLTNSNQQQAQFVERQRVEQDRFEAQQMDTEFADVLNRLADSENVLMRANAANRLAEMATRTRAVDGGMPTSTVLERYPFFVRATSHLASTLYIENDRSVRNEGKKALKKIILFAAGKAKETPDLLNVIIAEIADANRSALHNLAEALGDHCNLVAASNASGDGDEVEHASPFIELSDSLDNKGKLAFLSDLASSPKCAALRKVRRSRYTSKPGSDTQIIDKDSHLETIWIAGALLRDTVEVLSEALNSLPPPAAYPVDIASLENWKPQYVVDLRGCAMPGADLEGVHIPLACLNGSYLHGANLMGAHLTGADLSGAMLEYARLSNAHMQRATLNSVRLDHAKLQKAHLDGATIMKTFFSGAFLVGAYVSKSNDAPYGRTNLTDTNWWEADPLSWSGDEGEALKAYLVEAFPYSQTV